MRTEIAWRADENGILLGPAVHDSRLIKLLVLEGSLEFGMRRLSGDVVTVELSGVHDFTMHEVWNGAIVSEFWAWKVDSVPEALWGIPDSAWNVFFSNRMGIEAAKREAAGIARARPESYLVQLACSYGGAVAAVCDRVAVFEVHEQSAAG